ncbi:hypothetical protein [Sinomonas flava]|uniref:hypothetical protein n=1 Tax=Sinomonas flava TaxID=496857 RepID=UPI0039A4E155
MKGYTAAGAVAPAAARPSASPSPAASCAPAKISVPGSKARPAARGPASTASYPSARLEERVAAAEAALLAGFPADDGAALRALLARLAQAVHAADPGADPCEAVAPC